LELVAQGANDPRVKQAEADQMVKALKDKDIPVAYLLYPDEGHGFARPENNIAFFAVAENFLARHLGGLAEPIHPKELTESTIESRRVRPNFPCRNDSVLNLSAPLKSPQPARMLYLMR
jgi:acetyl esterase/lipase